MLPFSFSADQRNITLSLLGYRGSCICLPGVQVASRALFVFSVLGSISQVFSPCLALAPALSPSHSAAWCGRAGVLAFCLCARALRALPGLAVPARTQDLMSAPQVISSFLSNVPAGLISHSPVCPGHGSP